MTILAYWMAATYETTYVLLIAIVILLNSMLTAMRLFGEPAVPNAHPEFKVTLKLNF